MAYNWVTVAEGAALDRLTPVVSDFELGKGVPVRAVIDLRMPLGFLFNVAGVEHLFQARVPEGLVVTDVYGEGSKAIIEMESDPVWLLAALAFLRAHWLSLMIGGLTLVSLIAFMRIEVPEEFIRGAAEVTKWGAIALIALVAIILLGRRKAHGS